MVVTANQSVVDRGRLPTHDVPVLRKRRRRAQQRRRRLARIIQQTVDLHKMFNQEARRRNGGLDVGHVKGHSGDPLNDRADMLAGLGK